MKRKLLTLILSVFLVFAVWARGPEKNFPYEYYEKNEKSLRDFNLGTMIKMIRNDDKWAVTLYRSYDTDYIVFIYKDSAPSVSSIKDMLKESKSVWKNYDDQNGYQGVCHIFLNSKGDFIFSAEYQEYDY